MSFRASNSVTRREQRDSIRSVGCIAFALVLCSVLSACQNTAPERSLRKIVPDYAPNTAPAEVRLEGEGFLDIPLVRVSSRGRAALRSNYRVRLGAAFETDVVEVVGTDELEFTVPKELDPGVYDVVLVPPAGAPLTLKAGFVVTDGADPGTPPRLRLETKADGTGEQITQHTLPVGESLELFALLRDWRSVVVSQGEVVTFSQQPVLGVLSETVASATMFGARLPGTTTVRAVSDELGLSASATVRATGDLSDFTLSLEDAPHGSGKPLGELISKRAGDQLTVYAVVRKLSGEFALDVPATWQVEGAESTDAPNAESLSLPFVRAGDTTIQASFSGLAPASLLIRVTSGRAVRLVLEPDSAKLRAGDRAQKLEVRGEDALGNETADIGNLTYEIADGYFGDFDASNATLTPRHVGTGKIAVRSNYELAVVSGTFEVSAGPLARLSLMPNNLQLSADDSPVQFTVEGFDAFDNVTNDLGTLTWSVASGSITQLGELGEFEPITAGSGTISVTSSLGPSAISGTIEVNAGAPKQLNIQPQTWSGKVGDPAQLFSVTGSDADGNAVADIGTLSYQIATGPIATIDAQTGLFTPTVAGQGTIEVTSSYGLSGTSQNIVVSPLGATLRVSAIRAPSFFWAGEHGARVEVDVTSSDANEIVFSGVSLSFSSWSGDQASYFTVVPDRGNSDRVPAGGSRTLIFYVDIDEELDTTASITISATGEAFPANGAPFAFARSVATSSRIALTEPTLVLTAPVAPANRVCAGGQVTFDADASHRFSTSYEWRVPGGTFKSGSSAINQTPTVVYPSVGNFIYSVTATYFGYSNTLFGSPIYVGTAAAQPADTYPAGPILFSAPVAGEAIALASFPRSDVITINPAMPLRQCNNVPVDVSGHTALTVFSDRGLIDRSADVDPQAPGIQVSLTAAGGLGSIPLVAPGLRVEGETTLYAEYFDEASGTVTAGGDRTFRLSGDQQAPNVPWSIPGSDCGSACLAPGDWMLFHFSEPVLFSSLSNSKVELFSGTTCTGTASNVTSNATRSYEPAARVLYVKPPTRSGSYSIRVQLPSTITDTAIAKNALSVLSRCVVFGAIGSASTPAVPQLTAAAPSELSPDGDGIADSVTWKASADAATSFLRLRVTRAGHSVWARVAPVALPGEHTFVWDGSDEAGRIVGNGVYGYAIEAVNRSGVASAALRGWVEVDSTVRMVSIRREQ